MNLASVMDAIATQLGTISGLRVFGWPPGSLTPPAAVVGYPSTYTFDETYGRGMDRFTVPVVVVVGKATDRTARDALGAFVNGSGSSSVKAVLEAGTYSAFHELRVVSVEFDTYEIGATPYLAAIFDIDVVGTGA
jgi:hypothetical protein